MNYKEYLWQAKNTKISQHFTLYNICYSTTSLKNNINNTPSPQVISNARLLITNILEPCTSHFKTLPNVSCIFRCPELNKAVRGAENSQHRWGQAVDFTIIGVPLILIINYIRKNLIFDQLILESTWIHCSYKSTGNRKQVLKNVNGKYIAM